jgi:hypothetical protein
VDRTWQPRPRDRIADLIQTTDLTVAIVIIGEIANTGTRL